MSVVKISHCDIFLFTHFLYSVLDLDRGITRNKVICRYIDISIQDIVYQDQVIINLVEFETLWFKIFESLYVTMIGVELTQVIDPARKEPLHIL